MIRAAILLTFVVLAGCAKPLPPEVLRVEVPVPACPAPPATPLPPLPIASLAPDASPEQVARAWAETVALLRREVLVREAILAGYRASTPAP